MNCEEREKLHKLSTDANAKFKLLSLPPATEPLGIETPTGHYITKEHLEEISKAREQSSVAKEAYQNHIRNCLNCRQR